MRIVLPQWCAAPQNQPSQLSGLATIFVWPIAFMKRVYAER